MYAAIGVGKGRRDKSTGKFFSSIVYILLFIDQIQPRGIRKKLPQTIRPCKITQNMPIVWGSDEKMPISRFAK